MSGLPVSTAYALKNDMDFDIIIMHTYACNVYNNNSVFEQNREMANLTLLVSGGSC